MGRRRKKPGVSWKPKKKGGSKGPAVFIMKGEENHLKSGYMRKERGPR